MRTARGKVFGPFGFAHLRMTRLEGFSLTLGLDSLGRLSLRRRGCRYTTGEGARLSTSIFTLSLVLPPLRARLAA